MYAPDHIVKDGTAGHLGGLLLHELDRDLQTLTLGEGTQLGELRVYREDLFVLDIGDFAGVEEVDHMCIITHNVP